MSSISKNLSKDSKWMNKVEKYHWIYTFMYTDELSGSFVFEFDYNDNFLQKIKQ